MIDERTGKDLKDYPILETPKLYVYVMHNTAGKVKIGITRNIQQRYQSLCGSNCAGDHIDHVLVSPSTYLYSLEITMHNKFHRYRIPDTEWFYDKEDPSGESLYKNAVEYLKLLFSSTSYKKINAMRKEVEMKELTGGDFNDD